MHPTTSYQIATLQAAELHRRTELRSAHAPTRRPVARRAIAWGVRSVRGVRGVRGVRATPTPARSLQTTSRSA